jgi:DNA-directed RNA polymerase I subunit RPA2
MRPSQVPSALSDLVAPHVDSFDSFLVEGLSRVEEALLPVRVEHPTNGGVLTAWLERVSIGKPLLDDTRQREEARLFPRECRQAGTSYTAPLTAKLCWTYNEGMELSKEARLGNFPVMVRSAACNLHELSPQQLEARGEEAHELGGYFIVNGIERLLRLLINQRRHYIMGMVRGAYSRRGPTFSEFATAIRCVTPDESSVTVRVHYLTTGGARLAFVVRRQEYFIPARPDRCSSRATAPLLTPPRPRLRSS